MRCPLTPQSSHVACKWRCLHWASEGGSGSELPRVFRQGPHLRPPRFLPLQIHCRTFRNSEILFYLLMFREWGTSVCCSTDSCIPWLILHVPWPRVEPATLAHQDDALTHRAPWPGPQNSWVGYCLNIFDMGWVLDYIFLNCWTLLFFVAGTSSWESKPLTYFFLNSHSENQHHLNFSSLPFRYHYKYFCRPKHKRHSSLLFFLSDSC